jgi:2-dehydropantoate 2-reductase
VGELRGSPEGRALLQGLIAEALSLGRALAVDLPQDAAEKTWQTLENMPAGVRASMALDLERGNPLELSWLNGYVARRATERGLAAPLSRKVVEQLGAHAGGARR